MPPPYMVLDVPAEVTHHTPDQAHMKMQMLLPDGFVTGDAFRSEKVEVGGMRVGVLIYPKGADEEEDEGSSLEIFLKSYSEQSKTLDLTFKFTFQDRDERVKMITGVHLLPKRC